MQERLKEILKNENLTSAQFADKIGVQRSSISHILSGRNKPGFEFIQKILLSFPSIDANWLITGHGSIYQDGSSGPTLFDDSGDKATATTDALPQGTVQRATQSRKDDQTDEVETQKRIEKIMVFYKDKTFIEYLPDDV